MEADPRDLSAKDLLARFVAIRGRIEREREERRAALGLSTGDVAELLALAAEARGDGWAYRPLTPFGQELVREGFLKPHTRYPDRVHFTEAGVELLGHLYMSTSAPGSKAVYTLSDPRCGCVRYVGAARSPEKRLAAHIHKPDTARKADWLRDLKAIGAQPTLAVIAERCVEWAWVERFWISTHAARPRRSCGCDLLNVEGVP
jgi:hypothetical protein